MELGPILATLRCHKLTTALLAMQVALTCTVICNAVFLVVQRVARVEIPSGLDERGLVLVNVDDLQVGPNPLSLHQADVAALRALPDVESAAIVNDVPFSGVQNAMGVCGSLAAIHTMAASGQQMNSAHACAEPTAYHGGREALHTLGLQLVAGRDFHADEYIPGKRDYAMGSVPAAIISQALADRLYPSHPRAAVGRSLYFGSMGFAHIGSIRVVGVVKHLQRSLLRGAARNDLSMLLPVESNHDAVTFALRSKPANRKRVMAEALALLNRRRPVRQLTSADAETFTQVRAHFFGHDTAMIGMLLAATCGLLFVTAIGVAGLASFWVQQRTRSIGIRRALGATRRDILRYFQTENFLIVTFGIVPGMILAVGVNLLLMRHYAIPRLPLWYLPLTALALWLLGQLAVLAPALKASRVSPMEATRNV
ncbi:MAG TPA: FtsX-like permease family protein [Rhodanobacteraceae bacterium]